MALPIIKCQECNLTMRWQINKEEAVIHCEPCRRAVIVSDWNGDTKFLSQKPSDD